MCQSRHKVRSVNLVGPPEEGPAAETNDPAVVTDVLLIGFSHCCTSITGCQVEPVVRVLWHGIHPGDETCNCTFGSNMDL